MKGLPWFLILLCGFGCGRSPTTPRQQAVPVISGSFEKWIPLRGEIETAHPTTLRAELDGLSKLTWIIEDGTPVEAGEVLATFDPSALLEKRIQIERDQRLAKAELHALTQARHPLALQQLERERDQTLSEIQREKSILVQTRQLVEEQLLSQEELTQQQAAIANLESTLSALLETLRLTREILHPAETEQAQARLDATTQALDRITSLLSHTEVKAPIRGVVHLPRIPLDGDRRPVRVGDGLYKNQAYLNLADLTDLVIRCQIREQDLSRILPGQSAKVYLPAFPNTPYTAVVSSVGTRPVDGSRSYPVELRFENALADLRPGLSAELNVLVLKRDDQLQIPLQAVRGSMDEPYVVLSSNPGENHPVQLGEANEQSVVVLEGLNEGDRVLVP
jgi:multidrug efflux pump subunit AcrA (membrane-fusion protein)